MVSITVTGDVTEPAGTRCLAVNLAEASSLPSEGCLYARHAIYVTEVPFDIDLTCHCHQWRTREDKAVGAHSRLSLRPCQGALGAPPHLGTSVSAKKSQILQEALTKQTNKKPLASGDPCLQTYRLAKVANAYKPIKKTVFNLF
jgi:hypothetical protein